MKITLLCLIFLLSTCLGGVKAYSFSARLRSLFDIESYIIMFKNEIRASGAPPLRIINTLNGRKSSKLFSRIEKYGQGATLSEMYKSVKEEYSRESSLKESDLLLLDTFFSSFENNDLFGLLQSIEHVLSGLTAAMSEARDELKKNAKLYISLGAVFGAFIFILLI